jgi:hypothetical protein
MPIPLLSICDSEVATWTRVPSSPIGGRRGTDETSTAVPWAVPWTWIVAPAAASFSAGSEMATVAPAASRLTKRKRQRRSIIFRPPAR